MPDSVTTSWSELDVIPSLRHRQADFSRATRSTYAMLLCEGRPDLSSVFSSHDQCHAEHHLLNSPQWREALEMARRRGGSQAAYRALVTVVINRAPCHTKWKSGREYEEDRLDVSGRSVPDERRGCTNKLIEAIARLRPALNCSFRSAQVRFRLVMLGTYESTDAAGMSNREHQGPTTMFDLRALIAGGWTLRVLEHEDGKLTNYGRILVEGIRRIEQQLKSGDGRNPS